VSSPLRNSLQLLIRMCCRLLVSLREQQQVPPMGYGPSLGQTGVCVCGRVIDK